MRHLTSLSLVQKMTVPESGIETLFGSFDENLRNLETLFNVRIRTHGHELIAEGTPSSVSKVGHVIDALSSLLREGYTFSKANIETASKSVSENKSVNFRDYFLRGSMRSAVA